MGEHLLVEHGTSSARSTTRRVLSQSGVVVVVMSSAAAPSPAVVSATTATVVGGSRVAMVVAPARRCLVLVLNVLDVLEIGLVGGCRRGGQQGRARGSGPRRLGLRTGAPAGGGVVLTPGLVLALAPGLVPVLGSLLLLRGAELVVLRRLGLSGHRCGGLGLSCGCSNRSV